MIITCWRVLIAEEMARHGESHADAVHCSLDEAGLGRQFDSDFGMAKGEPFLLWTHRRVYFPVLHDGGEWVGSVPRDPCNEKLRHHFGGQ